jgi:hypothetical protein
MWWRREVIPIVPCKKRDSGGQKKLSRQVVEVFRLYALNALHSPKKQRTSHDLVVCKLLEVLAKFCNTEVKHEFFNAELTYLGFHRWLHLTLCLTSDAEQGSADILYYIHQVKELLVALKRAKRHGEVRAVFRATESLLGNYRYTSQLDEDNNDDNKP